MGKYGSGLTSQEVCELEVAEAGEILSQYDVGKEDTEIILGMIRQAYYMLSESYRFGNPAESCLTEKQKKELWISVKDNMPECGVRVLVFDKWGHIGDRTLKKYGKVYVFSPDGLLPGEDVTHWMPLPEPPAEFTAKRNRKRNFAGNA